MTGNGITLAIDLSSNQQAPTEMCSAASSNSIVIPPMITDTASFSATNDPGAIDGTSTVVSTNGLASKTMTSGSAVGTPASHEVIVGPNSELAFSPNQLTASVGDVVHFIFRANNHSVVQSSIEEPCVPVTGGFNSGFNQFNPNNDDDITVSFTVNTNEPRFFFCDQRDPVQHCAMGMVFALNPGDKFNAFASNVVTQGPLHSVGPSTILQTATLTSAGKEIISTITSLALPTVSLLVGTITLPTFFTSTTATQLVSDSSVA